MAHKLHLGLSDCFRFLVRGVLSLGKEDGQGSVDSCRSAREAEFDGLPQSALGLGELWNVFVLYRLVVSGSDLDLFWAQACSSRTLLMKVSGISATCTLLSASQLKCAPSDLPVSQTFDSYNEEHAN